MLCSNPRLAVSAGRQQSKADLVRLQSERHTQALQLSYQFRLESIARQDTIEWLEWISATSGSLQGFIDRIKAGDAYLESAVLELRTEMGI